MRKRVIVLVLVVCLLLAGVWSLLAQDKADLLAIRFIINRQKIALITPIREPHLGPMRRRQRGSLCDFEVSLSLEHGFEAGRICWDRATALHLDSKAFVMPAEALRAR